jgi:hypothetical protein
MLNYGRYCYTYWYILYTTGRYTRIYNIKYSKYSTTGFQAKFSDRPNKQISPSVCRPIPSNLADGRLHHGTTYLRCSTCTGMLIYLRRSDFYVLALYHAIAGSLLFSYTHCTNTVSLFFTIPAYIIIFC